MNLIQFQQAVASTDKPIVVDFWAPWCVPCRVTKPILEKLAGEYTGKVEFMPINADTSREVLEQFQVSGIPTVLALRNGKVVGRVTGSQSEVKYRALFEGLAEGREVKIPLTSFDRMLRLGAGTLFVAVGISTGNWLVSGLGGLITFLGIYDRCPIWRAVTGLWQRR